MGTEKDELQLGLSIIKAVFQFMAFLTIIIVICFVLFSGEPDLHDSIINFLNSPTNQGINGNN